MEAPPEVVFKITDGQQRVSPSWFSVPLPAAHDDFNDGPDMPHARRVLRVRDLPALIKQGFSALVSGFGWSWDKYEPQLRPPALYASPRFTYAIVHALQSSN